MPLRAPQFVERLVESALQVGFVAGDFHQGVGGFGIIVDNIGEARVGIEGGIVELGIRELEALPGEETHFESSGASHAPLSGYEILEQRFFGGADRLIFGFVGVAESFELITVFVIEQQGSAGKPVFQGVEADGSASFRCRRASAFLRIAAIGVDLSLRCHFTISYYRTV